jgi:hypothetical protein
MHTSCKVSSLATLLAASLWPPEGFASYLEEVEEDGAHDLGCSF